MGGGHGRTCSINGGMSSSQESRKRGKEERDRGALLGAAWGAVRALGARPGCSCSFVPAVAALCDVTCCT
jgi:hypothetical protein